MKFARNSMFVVLAAVALLTIGCSKETTTPTDPKAENRLTLNGDGYTNKKFTFPNANASFMTASGLTAVAIGDSAAADTADTPGTIVFFKGSAPGTYVINPDDSTAIIWVVSDSNMYALEAGTLVITEFGAVGGKIKGTFTGTASMDFSGNPVSVTITDGAFTAIRLADDQLDFEDIDPSVDFAFRVDGHDFDDVLVNVENTSVIVRDVNVPNRGMHKQVVATGMADFNGKSWIVSITLTPAEGEWREGLFAWIGDPIGDFHSTVITLIPELDTDGAITLFSDGTFGSTIIQSVEGSVVTGVFSGKTYEGSTQDTYDIHGGRFTFEIP